MDGVNRKTGRRQNREKLCLESISETYRIEKDEVTATCDEVKVRGELRQEASHLGKWRQQFAGQ